ncbi:hypothetical protein SH584_08455 [Sphingomonas sp. LY29]|uniref:hypothetical protein n=1 Tax=Sphingomonas sp. LY29 TaxID=3095341 RepID=UPI002D797AD3|nr:hypothetical protein [Sphingomonas sp. LY29]WRP25082.1 hypothetical protein SH584_08455 [Sphingomonas sp. LY29]
MRLFRSALAMGVAIFMTGCSDSSDGPSAAQTEETVAKEARNAVALSMQAVGGSGAKADARWFSCVQGMAWKYDGGGTFRAPEGNEAAQLEAIRTALTRAGYTDTTKVDRKVVVGRGDFSFVIYLRLRSAKYEPHWAFSFSSPCKGYPSADRKRIDSAARPRDTVLP